MKKTRSKNIDFENRYKAKLDGDGAQIWEMLVIPWISLRFSICNNMLLQMENLKEIQGITNISQIWAPFWSRFAL